MSKEIRITIADDHPIFRQGLRQMLEADPAFVVVGESDNGADALQEAKRLKPDLALLDVSMPGIDGLEIARICQREKLGFDIVLLTMHRDETIFNAAIDLGVKGYVLKESAATDIIRALRAAAAGNHFVSSELTEFMLGRQDSARKLRESVPGIGALTRAERRVLRLIASDRTTKEIADDLDLSPRTIDSHRSNICAKLGLSGSHSLLKFAFENRSHL